MSDNWGIYLSKNKTVVRVDMGIIGTSPIYGANTIVKISMRTRNLFSKKLNYKLIGTAEDEIGSQLTEHDFFVGAITYGDAKSFYIYTKQENRLTNMLNNTLSKYKNLKYEILIGDDPSWERYLEDLYPDIFERQWMQDRNVVDLMGNNGDHLQTAREIKHWLYFENQKSREDFKSQIDPNIYRIIEENELEEDSKFPFQLIISHTSAVEFETISQYTTELLKKAIEVGGDYDGWESPVIVSK